MPAPSIAALEHVLKCLLEDYRELQPPRPQYLPRPPTSLEALRMVQSAHPTVIQGFSPLTISCEEWDWDEPGTYEDILGNGEVSIAITDDGYADSVRTMPDGTKAFVKPLEEKMGVSDFLNKLCDQANTEIMYLQSQDGNIHRSHPREGGDELQGMRTYVERDIPWMIKAVGESAEAVNLWIGSSRSVTSLHHDPYENIYHVLSGSKTFTLISPIEGLWLSPTLHRSTHAISDTSAFTPILDPPPTYPIPWVENVDIPSPIQPIVITLQKGETLYLPSGWWHRVEQAPGPGGLAVAVNYWYNSSIQPAGDALLKMARRVARLAGREGVIPVDMDDSEGSSKDDGASGRGVPDGIWAEGGEDSDSGVEWEPSDWGR